MPTSAPRPSGFRIVLSALVLVGLAACGRPGLPVPPEQRLPAAAANLTAIVRAGGVELHWVNPTRRVDGKPLRDLTIAQVLRSDNGAEGVIPSAVLSRGRIPGYNEIAAIRLAEPSPATVVGSAVTLVDRAGLVIGRRYTYVVVTSDSERRTSPPSSRLTVSFIATPGPPRDLAADASEGEVRLRWAPPAQLSDGSPPGDLSYEILRGPRAGNALVPVSATPTADRTFVDRSVANDQTYRYAVRAIRIVAETRAIGEPSDAIAATPLDLTPPSPPRDLVAIPSERTVRLSWRPNPEADLARYVVYRAGATGDFQRIGSVEPSATVFVDRDLAPGRYRYAVTAEDTSISKNESARSNDVTVSIP